MIITTLIYEDTATIHDKLWFLPANFLYEARYKRVLLSPLQSSLLVVSSCKLAKQRTFAHLFSPCKQASKALGEDQLVACPDSK